VALHLVSGAGRRFSTGAGQRFIVHESMRPMSAAAASWTRRLHVLYVPFVVVVCPHGEVHGL
jgi:hypothetical protein